MSGRLLYETPRFKVLHKKHSTGSAQMDLYYIEKSDAVLVVPYTSSGIVLLEVTRPLIDGLSIELPGGRIDSGEDPLPAARRELHEECGLQATRWDDLLVTRPLPSLTTEKVYVYQAYVELADGWEFKPPGGHEGISRAFHSPFAEAREYATTGKVRCSVDALALLLYLENDDDKE